MLRVQCGVPESIETHTNMNEDEAYNKLQEFLALAEELVDRGAYDYEELLSELESRLG
jgi:hypothetical protein